MSIDKNSLGAAIKQVRIARGMTQIELAGAAGLSKGGKSIALIEQGKRFVSVETLNGLARALDIPPACLAVLGSRSGGKNKAAAEFMKSLQDLISSVLLAQADLRIEEKAEQTKRSVVDAERAQLAQIARRMRKPKRAAKSSRKAGKKVAT